MSNHSTFFHGGMTPRAWRMIAYSCVGFLFYGLILLCEMLQNLQLSRIDQQMKMVHSQEQYDLDESKSHLELPPTSQTTISSTQPVKQDSVPLPDSIP